MAFTTLEESTVHAREEAIKFADWLWRSRVHEGKMNDLTWSELYVKFKQDLDFKPTDHAGL